jgi:hypothetical protein
MWTEGWTDDMMKVTGTFFLGGGGKLKLILCSETQNQPKNQLSLKKHKIKVIISQQILKTSCNFPVAL